MATAIQPVMNDASGSQVFREKGWVCSAKLAYVLQGKELDIVYQPVQFATGALSHYEALVRVVELDGLKSGYSLVRNLERTGDCHLLDMWVFDHVIEHLRSEPELRIACNMSAQTIEHAESMAYVLDVIRKSGVGSQLIIEITETCQLSDSPQTHNLMRLLKSTGCAIALDDFGAGYSSFGTLLNFKFDYIKLDGALVNGVADCQCRQTYVAAIGRIARQNGSLTVAEHIESQSDKDMAILLDIDLLQGYFIGQPAPLNIQSKIA
ncbi:EAL domain-containing protein [Neiella marina]|uniref:EAL domain-containing protein n=1 Tax=Neiella holothuriorum TaxID=2870530 RepID=A0ABS7EGG0_9GAMM|nr:EAL domain-containing protein [Neiella holothuriorum]MBW8191355.1 EAL domain-containing protein [Neiella holothuriorum]